MTWVHEDRENKGEVLFGDFLQVGMVVDFPIVPGA